jgi:phospholipase C
MPGAVNQSGHLNEKIMNFRLFLTAALGIALIATLAFWNKHAAAASAGAVAPASASSALPEAAATATPIKHLVVIFNENVSFDHYFGTYPKAANPPGEPSFIAAPGTPAVDNLATAHLLTGNPNFTNKENGADAAEPFRLDRTQANTADQNHAYTAEQQAYDGGKADLFPKYTGKGTPGGVGAFGTRGQVMGYFDGNTVTAMWQYAQHFALADNAYTDTYGPSTPGMLELIAGQTNGMKIIATTKKPSTVTAVSYYVNDGQGGFTMINDVDPGYDVCSVPKDQAMMMGRNIGDLLNDAGISWGGFMGGFNLTVENPNGTTGCKRKTHSPVVGADITDYIPHHNWFQYFASTANPKHLRPSSPAAIGYSLEHDGITRDPANHEYGLADFYAAVKAGNLPSVSYVKMPAYQDGHAGYSDPLDEQTGTVTLINFLEQQPGWKSTAVIVTWDDSDGWYDHAFAQVTSPSFDAQADQLDGPGKCGAGTPPDGLDGKPVNGRCGPGTRLPFLVISPWARANFVSHDRISLASVVRFVEDNWLNGQRLGGGSFDATAGSVMGMFDFTAGGQNAVVYLDPATGKQLSAPPVAK